MSATLVGNLIGRFVVSYFIVWIVLWLATTKRDWRLATRCTWRWYGVATVIVIFSLGLLAAAARMPSA